MNLLSINIFNNQNNKTGFVNEILSGLAIALLFIPESAVISKLLGINTSYVFLSVVVFGFVRFMVNGKIGIISGSRIVIPMLCAPLIKEHGMEYFFAMVLLIGVLQLILVLIRFDKLINLIPKSIVYGFGLALTVIMIFDFIGYIVPKSSNLYNPLVFVIPTIALALILVLKNYFSNAAVILLTIGTACLIGFWINIPYETIESVNAVKSVKIPFLSLPNVPFTMETLNLIFKLSLTFSLLGFTEAIYNVKIADNFTESNKGNLRKESLTNGFSNVLLGFFSLPPGLTIPYLSFINFSNNTKSNLSGLTTAFVLLLVALFGLNFVNHIPIGICITIIVFIGLIMFYEVFKRLFLPLNTLEKVIFIGNFVITLLIHYKDRPA